MTTAELSTRTCPTCGEQFCPKRSHHWECWPCWSKRTAASASEIAHLKGRVKDLEEELKIVKRDRWFLERRLEDRNREIDALRCALLEARLTCQSALSDDFAEQIPRLLQLCHPDRHGNSEAATKATQWLLRQKEVRRR